MLLNTLVEWSRCLNTIMQSPLPLRSFEHSGPMMLCACPHVLVVLLCTACAWWEQVHKFNAVTYVEVYQAALTRRGTPKHACLQIVLSSSGVGIKSLW